MTRLQPLGDWPRQVADAFPQLFRPQATVLALYSFGTFLAHGGTGSGADPIFGS